MDASRLQAQITAFITSMIESPLSFALWLIGTIAIVAVFSTIMAPIFPTVFKPYGEIQRWVYVAGFVWLMKGAGR